MTQIKSVQDNVKIMKKLMKQWNWDCNSKDWPLGDVCVQITLDVEPCRDGMSQPFQSFPFRLTPDRSVTAYGLKIAPPTGLSSNTWPMECCSGNSSLNPILPVTSTYFPPKLRKRVILCYQLCYCTVERCSGGTNFHPPMASLVSLWRYPSFAVNCLPNISWIVSVILLFHEK